MKETLLMHQTKLEQLKADLDKANQAYIAYNKSFEAWIQSTLELDEKKQVMHLSDILKLWTEKLG